MAKRGNQGASTISLTPSISCSIRTNYRLFVFFVRRYSKLSLSLQWRFEQSTRAIAYDPSRLAIDQDESDRLRPINVSLLHKILKAARFEGRQFHLRAPLSGIRYTCLDTP